MTVRGVRVMTTRGSQVMIGAIWGPFQDNFEPSWGHFGPSWGHLRPSWGHRGAILGPSWGILAYLGLFGTILGPFWDHFGTILGPFWDDLGIILGRFVLKDSLALCLFWSAWACEIDQPRGQSRPKKAVVCFVLLCFAFLLVFFLALSVPCQTRSHTGLGPSWGYLGAILGHLGAILGSSWAILLLSWGHLRPC